MRNKITERKSTLEGIKSTLNDAEERTSELEDRGEGVTVTRKEGRNEYSLRISGTPSRALILTLQGSQNETSERA